MLTLCIAHRTRIIEDVDGSSSKTIDLSQIDSEDDDDMQAALGQRGPSAEALAKINDYRRCWTRYSCSYHLIALQSFPMSATRRPTQRTKILT